MIEVIPSKTQVTLQKKEQECVRYIRHHKGLKNSTFETWYNYYNSEWVTTVVICTGPTQYRSSQELAKERDGAHSYLVLIFELLASDRFWEMGNHWLSLHILYWAHKAPTESSYSTQINVPESQNRCRCER